MRREKRGFRDRGKQVVGRTLIVVGFTTVCCWIGTMVILGAFTAGLAERFGRPPMKPPQ